MTQEKTHTLNNNELARVFVSCESVKGTTSPFRIAKLGLGSDWH